MHAILARSNALFMRIHCNVRSFNAMQCLSINMLRYRNKACHIVDKEPLGGEECFNYVSLSKTCLSSGTGRGKAVGTCDPAVLMHFEQCAEGKSTCQRLTVRVCGSRGRCRSVDNSASIPSLHRSPAHGPHEHVFFMSCLLLFAKLSWIIEFNNHQCGSVTIELSPRAYNSMMPYVTNCPDYWTPYYNNEQNKYKVEVRTPCTSGVMRQA